MRGNRSIAFWLRAVCLGFALLGLSSGAAQAQVFTTFGLKTFAFPGSITAGPDGNLWFTENNNQIGRITPLGVVTEFSAGITGASGSITAGPDGNVWFTEGSGQIGRITPLGVVTEFSAGLTGAGSSITAGPDGNVWFTEFGGDRIGRITPLGVVTEFSAGITAGSTPWGITAGPDGNLWFTESGGNRIGRITPLGVVTEFSAAITGVGFSITAGSDGNLWFRGSSFNPNPGGMPHFFAPIARITPLGVVTQIAVLGSGDITTGPDGNLWITRPDFEFSAITRLSLPLAAGPPTIGKFFGVGVLGLPLALNASTSLTFSINNFNTLFALTGVGFTDTLPPGLVVSTPNGLSGSCGGGTVVATAGSGAVSLTGATLTASASCSFSVNVTGTTIGTKNNVTGAVTSLEGGSGGTASASVSVVATGPPTIAMSFGAATIPLNGSTSLSFTINNPNPSTTLTGVGFSGSLLGGLVVSTPNGLAGSCGGGTIVANAGSNGISLTGATLAGNASCTFRVNVTGITLGTYSAVTFPVISAEGGSGGNASATVTVVAGTSFHATTPCRVLDTRDATSALGGPALAAGAARDFIVTGTCGIPAAAVSISVNVTITEPTSAGTVFTLPAALPLLAFQAGVTRANNAFLLLALDGSGAVTFSNDLPSGSVQLIVDVDGWWQ